MPRVRSPSHAEVAAQPRAFALLHQITASADGELDAQALKEFVKLYGEPSESPSEGELSFAEFAALFRRPAISRGVTAANCIGYASRDSGGELSAFSFDRRPVGAHDVRIQITHVGMCHSDLHQVKNEWGNSQFPMVPGHEIVGIVTEVGPEVSAFKPGDRAGVGCMVDSCGSCEACKETGEEQFCSKVVYTYNSKGHDGEMTQGGYSTAIVVRDTFAVHIPANLPLDAAAPLLCAGITVYSPLRHFGLDKPGMRIGVVGLGGLGHMAVKLAKAMGAHVTVISTSAGKKEEAMKVLGADAFLVSRDPDALTVAANSLHGIIDTVSAKHDLGALIGLLRVDGKLVLVGVPEVPLELASWALISKRITIGGSPIGGIRQTQEMLDFCGQHNITASIEKIPIEYANTAFERMKASDIRYRFVIDIQGSLAL
ncbi:putative mannitol dehydrogenase [Tetrabaena socialis]|uniref:Putative mannitol dehydrogenase n=1 Tax=Tetrabaena socialis TaxID=47790 RepID=A0A2J8A2T6_9CHLO|nr:putative mannitol dehydrogenase [Tetrabaena socialis]|eukprot:PNH06839.1 putative mannitol dehydrogenase [Tetrabaena socialis]